MNPIVGRTLRWLIKGIPDIKITANILESIPSERLKNKKILITGGGKGLGLAITKRFVYDGAKVLITGRDEIKLKQASHTIGCEYLSFDIRNSFACDDLILHASEILGGLDILVNNAGISLHEKSFFDVTPETFKKQITTNLEGPFFLTQAFISYLKKQNQTGNVLFISSEAGETADFRPYGYTKAAVNSMVSGLAYLFKQEGIRINAIAPGVTATDMTGVAKDGNLNAGNYGTGRFYLPEEIAEVATFLVSDIAGCISGQIITCNNANTVNARWR